jgi:energy-coupling factor transporter ATP-binding protein EcfA2
VICTHDSNLVDRMKKRVIEISDGCIIRDELASGYSGIITPVPNDIKGGNK